MRREWGFVKDSRVNASRFPGILVLEFTRHPPFWVVSSSRIARRVLNLKPAWAKGAFVVVPGLGPGDAWEARVTFGGRDGIGPSHIVVRESDVETLMADIRVALPWNERPTERRWARDLPALRILDDEDDEAFNVSEAPSPRFALQQTFITILPTLHQCMSAARVHECMPGGAIYRARSA